MANVLKTRYGPQTAATWRDLAHRCSMEAAVDTQERLRASQLAPLTPQQVVVIRARLYACIVAAFDAVAVEAMKGEDVSAAAGLHNPAHAEASGSRDMRALRDQSTVERELIQLASVKA